MPDGIKSDVLTMIDEAIQANTKKARKSANRTGYVQVDATTNKEIARFDTQKDALTAIGKDPAKTGISDAANGRSSTHIAYGYKWYHTDEWESMKA